MRSGKTIFLALNEEEKLLETSVMEYHIKLMAQLSVSSDEEVLLSPTLYLDTE